MITSQSLKNTQAVIMELIAERRAVYDDYISNNMQKLAKKEMKHIEVLHTVMNMLQERKDYEDNSRSVMEVKWTICC